MARVDPRTTKVNYSVLNTLREIKLNLISPSAAVKKISS
jgi:hypothetical protein